MNTKVATLLTAAIGLSLVAVGQHSISAASTTTEDAIQAVVIRDVSLGIEPFLPCTSTRAQLLTTSMSASAKQALANRFALTYTTGEPSHGKLLAHMNALIDQVSITSNSSSPSGNSAQSQYRLCQKQGGVDNVQVTNYANNGTSATMTLQYHAFQELVGVDDNGVSFDHTINSVETQTDQVTYDGSQWLVATRGSVSFISGAP